MSAARVPGPWVAPLAFDPTDEGTMAVCRMPAPGAVGRRAPLNTPGGAALGFATLRRGTDGVAVARLQVLLAQAVPAAMAPHVDGHFGLATEHALRRFQRAHGLLDDGIADAWTWQALLKPRATPRDVEHSATTSQVTQSPHIRWMDIARAEIGQSEVAGARHNPRIIEYHASTRLRPTSDEIPWCASFVNWVMQQAGLHGTRSSAAASWIHWGVPCELQEGAVIVIHNARAARSSLTASGNHVGFLVQASENHYVVLGGNQSDQVKESRFSRSSWQLRACRWPAS
jgi:uncharacterized protein (TIGR02594 family)